ncbi:MAG TPA: Rieske (2Fe-2S) protein [Chloroflexota bacterium]|nr:Rieske (2Fe-2S) protein [Chloroflexota bacterium]
MRDGAPPTYLPAARVKDVKPGQLKGVRLRGGHEVVLANQDGRVYAFEAYCPHQGWPLKWGVIDRGTVVCALHVWRFDLDTGAVVDPPMGDCLRTYPTRIEGDQILVGIDSL